MLSSAKQGVICHGEFTIGALFEKILIPVTCIVLLCGFSIFVLLGKLNLGLAVGAFFMLFFSEQVCNFINRTNISGIQKLAGTFYQRPVSLCVPLVILFSLYHALSI